MRSRIGWALAAAALLAAGALWNLAEGVHPWDESWFLRVVARVRAGEVLYRDVYFGVMPLSVGLGVAMTHVFGVEIAAIKAARVVCFAASALLAARIALQLSGRRRAALFVLPCLLLFAPPTATSLYSPLAGALLLATATLALGALAGGAREALLAGACAGLCFAAKQNLGVLAGLALAAALLLAPARGEPLAWRLAAPLAAGVAAVLVALAPVAAQGGLAQLADDGFLGKGSYLAHGGVGYSAGLAQLRDAAARALGAGGLAPFFRLQVFLLPALSAAVAGLALRAAQPAERRALVVASAFAAAAFAGIYPRAGLGHLMDAAPALLALAAGAWPIARRGVGARAGRAAEVLAIGWVAIGLGTVVAERMAPLLRGERVWSSAPHLGGALLDPGDERGLHAAAAQFATAIGDEALLLSPRAGLLYLVTGLRNPTRFDWTGVISMGSRGEEETIERVRRGEIRSVCIDPVDWGLNPRRLEEAVRAHMERVADLGRCVLYRAPPREP